MMSSYKLATILTIVSADKLLSEDYSIPSITEMKKGKGKRKSKEIDSKAKDKDKKKIRKSVDGEIKKKQSKKSIKNSKSKKSNNLKKASSEKLSTSAKKEKITSDILPVKSVEFSDVSEIFNDSLKTSQMTIKSGISKKSILKKSRNLSTKISIHEKTLNTPSDSWENLDNDNTSEINISEKKSKIAKSDKSEIKISEKKSKITKSEKLDISLSELSDISKSEDSEIIKSKKSEIIKSKKSEIIKSKKSEIIKSKKSEIIKSNKSEIIKNEESETKLNDEDENDTKDMIKAEIKPSKHVKVSDIAQIKIISKVDMKKKKLATPKLSTQKIGRSFQSLDIPLSKNASINKSFKSLRISKSGASLIQPSRPVTPINSNFKLQKLLPPGMMNKLTPLGTPRQLSKQSLIDGDSTPYRVHSCDSQLAIGSNLKRLNSIGHHKMSIIYGKKMLSSEAIEKPLRKIQSNIPYYNTNNSARLR